MMHVLSLSLALFLPSPSSSGSVPRSSISRKAHTLAKIYSLSLSPTLSLSLRTPRDLTHRCLAQKRAARTTWRLCQRRGLCPSACRTGGFNSAPFRPVPISYSLRRSRASRSLSRRSTLTFPLHDALLSSFPFHTYRASAMHSRF